MVDEWNRHKRLRFLGFVVSPAPGACWPTSLPLAGRRVQERVLDELRNLRDVIINCHVKTFANLKKEVPRVPT